MSIKTTNLPTLFPDLIKEWHPSKNDELKPQDFTYGSDRKVWWVCNKGLEWQNRSDHKLDVSNVLNLLCQTNVARIALKWT